MAGLKIVRASDLTPKRMEWIWYPYIPANHLTMIQGDPGTGKTWLCCEIAAAVTKGRPLPGDLDNEDARVPRNVLILSAEDDPEELLLPRMRALNADLDRMFFSEGEDFSFTLRGLQVLENQLREMAVAILLVDPLEGFFKAGTDSNKANDVREVLTPLNRVAMRTGCTIIGLRHLRKSGGKAQYSGIGSIAFTAVMRSGLSVEAKGKKSRIKHIKCNYAQLGAPLDFRVEDGHFSWVGFVDEQAEKDAHGNSKVAKARAFLRDVLAGGPLPAADVRAKANGLGAPELKNAKKGLVEHYREDGKWMWRLVESEQGQAEEDLNET